jgi:dolichol-phosphate mannosyltransferase
MISLTARKYISDTTNNFRAYSRRYLYDTKVNIFRDIFYGYELLAYLSVRWSQIGYNFCEVPVTRSYPKNKKIPTKISSFRGNLNLIKILIKNLCGKFNP